MTRNRFKISILRKLRNVGLLCKKPHNKPMRMYVAKTVLPDGDEIMRSPATQLEELYNTENTISVARHVWIESKKAAASNCRFDSATSKCDCGIGLDDFASSGCSKSKRKSK